jgi:hypothetical protein
VTNEEGRYLFTGLVAGDYLLREIQPIQYVDGKDKVGEIFTLTGGATSYPDGSQPNAALDEFNITLPENVHADYYYFGERGLAAGYVSKRFLTGARPLREFESGLKWGEDEPGFVIPEPATLYLMTIAAGIGLLRPRRRRASIRRGS